MIKLSLGDIESLVQVFKANKGVLKKGKVGRFYVKDKIPHIIYSSNINFIHEYFHFIQWKEGTIVNKTFNESVKDKDVKAFNEIIKLELDCEKRVINFLVKINKKHLSKYSKRVNTYIYLCHEIFKGKKIDYMRKNSIFDNSKDYLLKDKDYLHNPHLLIY